MSIIARQSTARTFMVGPILDADGVAVTDGVIGDLKLSKNGAAPAAFDGSATLTHRHTGHYSLAATTSDLDTVGQAEVVIDDTTNAMPPKAITVIEEAVYDALFAASAAGFASQASVDGLPTATENADALLKRDWTEVTGEAARSVLNALRFLRNKWSISGSTLTVNGEDDSTTAWTGTVSSDANAEPVTGNDPS